MAADDTVRYRLRRKLTELVGSDEADLLMTGVPPFPWAEVATKHDLRALRSELLGRIGGQTRTIVLANLASVLVGAGIVLAAVRL